MHWIALPWRPDEEPLAAGAPAACPHAWWALRWTPRVAVLDEALLLEVSGCERLWGGRTRLIEQLQADRPAPGGPWAEGATALVALALLRLRQAGHAAPASVPQGLPLHTLSAARPHLATPGAHGLPHLGRACARCRVAAWRGASARPCCTRSTRPGAMRPSALAWLELPDVFEQTLELPALVDSAPGAADGRPTACSRPCSSGCRARQQGALALELAWHARPAPLQRHGPAAAPQASPVRTAQPTQDMAHLRRLLSEHLARTTLAAPASRLRLRALRDRALGRCQHQPAAAATAHPRATGCTSWSSA